MFHLKSFGFFLIMSQISQMVCVKLKAPKNGLMDQYLEIDSTFYRGGLMCDKISNFTLM